MNEMNDQGFYLTHWYDFPEVTLRSSLCLISNEHDRMIIELFFKAIKHLEINGNLLNKTIY